MVAVYGSTSSPRTAELIRASLNNLPRCQRAVGSPSGEHVRLKPHRMISYETTYTLFNRCCSPEGEPTDK